MANGNHSSCYFLIINIYQSFIDDEKCGGDKDVTSMEFIKLSHFFIVHFGDSFKIPEHLHRVLLTDKLEIETLEGKQLYEKYAVAPTIAPTQGFSGHTYVFLRLHDNRWVKVDNDIVTDYAPGGTLFHTYAVGGGFVIYRKKRGDSKKFYPRYIKE